MGQVSSMLPFIVSAEPTIPPKNLSIVRRSGNEMEVSWVPLSYSEARGFISNYSVLYSPLASGDTSIQTIAGMGSDMTIVRGLDSRADYRVQISATNGAGTSPLSLSVLAPAAESADGEEGSLFGVIVGVTVGAVCMVLLIVICIGVIILVQWKKRLPT